MRFKTSRDLVRIGRDHDGGYLVSQADIERSDHLIGLGMFDDWSFEESFVGINDVPVTVYDASVNYKFWIQRVFVEFLKNPIGFYGLSRLISYQRFFRNHRTHIKKFIGVDTSDPLFLTLDEVFAACPGKSIFVKIDIEGSEYRLLDSLVKHQDRLSGLAIELHDCDLHLGALARFVEEFDIPIAHIHANNYAPIRAEDELPLSIEMTFSRYSEWEKAAEMPHKLDMNNKIGRPDIHLEFG